MAKPTSDAFTGATLDAKWTAETDVAATASIGLTGAGALRFTFQRGFTAGYGRVNQEFEGPWIRIPSAVAQSDAENFNLVLKFNSDFTADGAAGVEQTMGLMFHNTNAEFIAFFISKESTGVRARMLTQTGTINNSITVGPLADWQAGYYIRVTRDWNSGNSSNYTLETSPDGITWTFRGTNPQTKTAAGLRYGIFAGNRGADGAAEWEPTFDFVEEASDPLSAGVTVMAQAFGVFP